MPREMASPKRRKASKRITRACSRCGRTEECSEGGLPPGWAVEAEGRRIGYLCPSCARANIRAIEGRLAEVYWDF